MISKMKWILFAIFIFNITFASNEKCQVYNVYSARDRLMLMVGNVIIELEENDTLTIIAKNAKVGNYLEVTALLHKKKQEITFLTTEEYFQYQFQFLKINEELIAKLLKNIYTKAEEKLKIKKNRNLTINDADHDITKITYDVDNAITQELLQEIQQEIGWTCTDCTFENNPISKICEVCGEVRYDLNTPQHQQNNLDWFHDLKANTQDNMVRFLSQAIEQFGTYTEDVVKDMEREFEITPQQIYNLYIFAYCGKDNSEEQTDGKNEESLQTPKVIKDFSMFDYDWNEIAEHVDQSKYSGIDAYVKENPQLTVILVIMAIVLLYANYY